MLRTIIVLVLSPFFLTSSGWTQTCEEGCRHATTFNGASWVALRNPTNNNIQVNVNTSLVSPQPGGTTLNLPALNAFGGQVFLVVRGTDPNQGVWVNRWTGSSWTGWINPQQGTTTNGPDMSVFNNTLFLVVAGADVPNRGLWVNRYTTSWQGWSGVANLFTSAQTCASSSLRVGGTRTDGRCWRLTSTNGTTWSGPTLGNPCP